MHYTVDSIEKQIERKLLKKINIEITSENFQNTRIVMSKILQNLVVLMAPIKDAHDHSLKAGNMILNRFCIDEDAAFEFSGVNYLTKSSFRIKKREFKVEGKVKG